MEPFWLHEVNKSLFQQIQNGSIKASANPLHRYLAEINENLPSFLFAVYQIWGCDKGSDGDRMDEIILKPTALHPRAAGADAAQATAGAIIIKKASHLPPFHSQFALEESMTISN